MESDAVGAALCLAAGVAERSGVWTTQPSIMQHDIQVPWNAQVGECKMVMHLTTRTCVALLVALRTPVNCLTVTLSLC